MNDSIKSQLGILLGKAAPKAAIPEPSKDPINVDGGVTTEPPKPTPVTDRELDRIVSAPIQESKPKTAAWEPSIPTQEAKPATLPETPEVFEWDIQRAVFYAHIRDAKIAIDKVVKLTDDYIDRGWQTKLGEILYELKMLHPKVVDAATEIPKPDSYLARENRTPRGGQEAITGYESPESKATWTGRKY